MQVAIGGVVQEPSRGADAVGHIAQQHRRRRRALGCSAVPRRAQRLERVETRRRRPVIDEMVQLVVGHPHRSTQVFGLCCRHRGRPDAVRKHTCTEQRQVAELTQQHDVVDGLDCAQPVDELVEVEAIDRYR